MEWNQLWILGRRSTRCYVRVYPNPGFMVRAFGWEIKWSRFYGWARRRR